MMIHPPIAHVSIGAYTTAVVCDLLSVAGVGGSSTAHDLYRAGTFSFMVATGALFLSVISGVIERGKFTEPGSPERKKVNMHAAVMGAVGVLAVVDIVIRRNTSAASDPHTPIGLLALTLVVGALLVVGGRFGGNLVFRLGLGVNK